MAKLVISKGLHGVNKLHVLHPIEPPVGLVVFFPGDRIENSGLNPYIQRLQEPIEIVEIVAQKFPAHISVLITPSRVEACSSCYDHFFSRLTLTGEPLGYDGFKFKASEQLESLLKFAIPDLDFRHMPVLTVLGFSKGGVVLNQASSTDSISSFISATNYTQI